MAGDDPVTVATPWSSRRVVYQVYRTFHVFIGDFRLFVSSERPLIKYMAPRRHSLSLILGMKPACFFSGAFSVLGVMPIAPVVCPVRDDP